MAMSLALTDTMKSHGKKLVLLVFIILHIRVTRSEIGAVCSSLTDCSYGATCVDGHCNCTEIWYTEPSLTPVCRSWEYEKLCLHDNECWENAKCISLKCDCDVGYYRISSYCRRVQMQRLMMPCRTRSFGPDPRMCDIKKHSICVDNTCVCVKGYIPNASGVCESKESYASYLKLNEYRVKPGEYCRENTDCIEGLVCNKFRCNCPSDCNYRQRKEVCDCGKVDTEVWPIIIGVLLGMIVIVFWIWAIRKTIIKHKEKIKHSSHRTAIDNDDVPASHPLTPFQSSAQTETVDNTASPVRRTTGTPISRDNNTPRTYSPISPTVPRYPVDPESDKPPSYEEVISSPLYNPDPTSLQKALHPNYYIPLSSGTQQSSGPSYSPSERPHSYNPSPTTYPNSPYLLGPQFTTHRGSLDAIPHRVHPSATFNVASRSPPSYSSVPELQPPDNPNFHERSVSGSAGTHTDR